MTALATLETTLRKRKFSLTHARRSVFLALQDTEPLSISELLSRCSVIDRASVYRTVALFEQLGIVQRLQTGWKYKLELSDSFSDHHHHATCLVCGMSQSLASDEQLEQQIHKLSECIGFSLQRHQLELQGYCSQCQKMLQD